MVYNDYIVDLLKDKQISLLGFADLSEIGSEQRQGLKYGICFAKAIDVLPNEGIPTLAYYKDYKSKHEKLKELSLFLEEKIIEKGYSAYSLFRNKQSKDYRTLLPLKTLATRSGLGWIGKSSTLITKEFGNAVRFGGVITDMPFETAEPVNTSYCGDCRECVDKCPAKAIVGDNWTIASDRNDLVDPLACKSLASERGKDLGITTGSCGICISVCPWTKSYALRKEKEQS